MSASITRVASPAPAAGGRWLDRIAEAERGRFPPWLAVGMAAGALAYLALRHEPPGWIGGVATALAATGAWAARARMVIRAALLMVVAVSLGFAAGQSGTWRALAPEAVPDGPVVVRGRVHGVDLMPEGARRLVLSPVSVDGVALRRTVRVKLRPEEVGAVAAGDAVTVNAVLLPPAAPAYPGGWDQQRDAFFSGLAANGYAIGPVRVTGAAPSSGLGAWVRRLRDGIGGRVMAVLPGTEGAVAATLLTGATAAIPPADRAAFRDSGLAHLLAVAGLHIGIVMGLAYGAARFLLARSERCALFWPCRQIASVAALLAGAVYLVLTGGHVPILRSFGMAALFTLATLTGRRALSMRGLALAAATIIVVAPWEVGGVSFQMSFAAVAALIAGYEAMRARLRWLRGRGGLARGALHGLATVSLTSLLAGAATMPFAAYHFGHVQTWNIPANVVAVPLTAGWTLPWGMTALALMPFHLERLALTPMGWGIEATLWVARAASSLPDASVRVPRMPAAGLAVAAFGLLWLCLWRTRWRWLGVAGLAAGLVSPWLARPPDLLVSDDARLIGFRIGDAAYVAPGWGGSSFTRDAWAAYWAVQRLSPAPAGVCDGAGCAVRPRADAAAAYVAFDPPDAATCAEAAVVVVRRSAAGWCDATRPVLDRDDARHDGAHAVWLSAAGATMISDRELRGDRPWVPPPGSFVSDGPISQPRVR